MSKLKRLRLVTCRDDLARSAARFKIKDRVVFEVVVEDDESELVRWGDWARAARLRMTYTHPRSGIRATIDELVRVPDPEGFELKRGARAAVLCWGILRPSGRLRHPIFVGWVGTGGSRARGTGGTV